MNKKKKEHTNFQYDNKEEWEKKSKTKIIL